MLWEISSLFMFTLQISMIQRAEYLLLKKHFFIIRQSLESAQNAYRKHFKNTFETFYNIKVDISKRLDSTFKLMPKRWKVEHTFSWLCHSRRLSKDYEIKSVYSETMVIISHLHTLLNRF